MDIQEQLQTWEQRLQGLLLGQDIPLELRVLLEETVQSFQAASRLFSETQSVLSQSHVDISNHQEAFRHLMCVETRRNTLWHLMNGVASLWHVTMTIDDEWSPGNTLDAIWEIKFEVSDEFDKMGEVADIWIQRKAFYEAIRHLARPLTISNIPTELWNQIFEKVVGEQDSEDFWSPTDYVSGGRNVACIKNIRLACRRFCDASSHLLLRHVVTALDHESLARLDEISYHATFSKAVRALRVDLRGNLYNGRLAQDECAFVTATIDEICAWMRIGKNTCQISDYGRALLHSRSLPTKQIADAGDKAGRAVAFWLLYLESGCQKPVLDEHDVQGSAEFIATTTALHECYIEYRKRYEEQQHRQECSYSLALAVAAAVARMPNAARLFLTDDMSTANSCNLRSIGTSANAADLLDWMNLLVRERMLEPSRLSIQVNENPWTARLLHELPVALHQAGVSLLQFGVKVSWNCRASWELGEGDVSSLRALAKTLKIFGYHGPPDFPLIQASSMRQYLGAFVFGESLHKIGIDFQLDRAEAMEAGPVLASLSPGISLRSLTLRHCSLHLDQLKSVLQRCDPEESSVTLHEVELLSGTWADALDMLRDNVANTKSAVSIQRPTGAECDAMSRESYNAIFASGPNPDYYNSRANRYISDWLPSDIHNPLRPETAEGDVFA